MAVKLTSEQAAFLRAARVGHLATVGPKAAPHLVPVCFDAALDDDQFIALYSALDQKPKRVEPEALRRVRNLRANPTVTLLVDHYDDGDWQRLAFLRVDGQATIIEPDQSEHGRALTGLRAKYPQYRAMALADRPIIRIAPMGVRSWGPLTPPDPVAALAPKGVPFPDLVRARRSVRHFQPDPVPRAVVEELITAAGWAPSPHGRQPWRFAVVTRAETRASLAEAMGASWVEQLALDGQDDATIAVRLAGSQRRLRDTPLLIIPCLYTAPLDHYPDRARQDAEETMAVQSLGAAVQNLLLAATDRGLDSGWMCAPLFCPEIVRDTLGLPADLTPHAIITIGWAAREPKRRGRLPVESLIVHYD